MEDQQSFDVHKLMAKDPNELFLDSLDRIGTAWTALEAIQAELEPPDGNDSVLYDAAHGAQVGLWEARRIVTALFYLADGHKQGQPHYPHPGGVAP